MKRALLVVNPHSRRGREAGAAAVRHLGDRGISVALEQPDLADLARTIARYSTSVDLVIIGGGDGTLNAALAPLLDAQVPLGILPLGTANDLARTLQVPTAVSAACEAIASGSVQRLDVGCANDRYFFNVASIGLSVKIARRLTGAAKKRWGVLAYAVTAWQVLRQARPFAAEIVEADGTRTQVKTMQIAIGNGRHYGGGLTVTSDATIQDARLDLYSLEVERGWQVLGLLPALRFGDYTGSSQVRVLKLSEVEIRTDKSRSINTDGEIAGRTPAHFRVLPAALPAIVPRESS